MIPPGPGLTPVLATAGTLVAAKDFSSSVNVSNGDTLNVTYTINASSS